MFNKGHEAIVIGSCVKKLLYQITLDMLYVHLTIAKFKNISSITFYLKHFERTPVKPVRVNGEMNQNQLTNIF